MNDSFSIAIDIARNYNMYVYVMYLQISIRIHTILRMIAR